MIYLDANFFIFTNLVDTKGKQARCILKEITQGKQAITSSLALDEVMWVFLKHNLKHEIKKIIEEIYSIKNLEVKEVSSLIPLKAVQFMEEHNLKPRDAFHLAVMKQFGITEIVTDDKDFDKIPGIKRIRL